MGGGCPSTRPGQSWRHSPPPAPTPQQPGTGPSSHKCPEPLQEADPKAERRGVPQVSRSAQATLEVKEGF